MRGRIIGTTLILLLAATALTAEETEPSSLWSGNIGLAYLATTGNSDTTSLGLDFAMTREPAPWGVELKARFNRADEDGVVTAERYSASARAVRELSEHWEVFGGVGVEKDEFEGFELRVMAETGTTYRALLGPTHLLAFDFGLTWTDEDRVPPEADVSYLGGLLGLTYEWKLSETASLAQALSFYPDFDDSDNWRVTSETALQAQLYQRLAVQLSYEVRYRNEPIGDSEDTDTTARASLVFSL